MSLKIRPQFWGQGTIHKRDILDIDTGVVQTGHGKPCNHAVKAIGGCMQHAGLPWTQTCTTVPSVEDGAQLFEGRRMKQIAESCHVVKAMKADKVLIEMPDLCHSV